MFLEEKEDKKSPRRRALPRRFQAYKSCQQDVKAHAGEEDRELSSRRVNHLITLILDLILGYGMLGELSRKCFLSFALFA
jgi:hypothetical protein